MENKEKRPGVGLAIILMNLKNGNILLGRRMGAHGAGTWAFPGGHLEHFENYIERIEKEMKQETGFKRIINYQLLDLDPCKVTNDIFYREDKHYITLFFRARYKEGKAKVMEPDRCEEWKWYEWGKFPENLFVPVRNLLDSEYNPFQNLNL
jgi:8-oxo-dGTP diphosphatase